MYIYICVCVSVCLCVFNSWQHTSQYFSIDDDDDDYHDVF